MAPAFSDSDTRSASLPLVLVRALTVSYATRAARGVRIPALTNVNLEVPQRAAFGIFGESGCGKSTLLLSLAKLLRGNALTEGAVLFQGRNLLTQSERTLQNIRGSQIGIVLQEAGTALNPVRMIGEQVMEVLRAHATVSRRQSREAALSALDAVGLDAKRVFHAWPHQLSGGQQQRVLIAQALICSPSLLLADEPTHALDHRTRAEIADLLRRRSEGSNVALLVASHDPVVLRTVTERLFVFYAGQLIESGRTADVFAAPLHPYTRALIDCFQLAPWSERTGSPQLNTIPAAAPASSTVTPGCRFVHRCVHRRPVCSQIPPALLPAASAPPTSNREVRCHLYA